MITYDASKRKRTGQPVMFLAQQTLSQPKESLTTQTQQTHTHTYNQFKSNGEEKSNEMRLVDGYNWNALHWNDFVWRREMIRWSAGRIERDTSRHSKRWQSSGRSNQDTRAGHFGLVFSLDLVVDFSGYIIKKRTE